MKKIKIITSSSELEQFVNRTDIEIIQMDIKAVEQNIFAQEWFIAVIFYTEGNKCMIAEFWHDCKDCFFNQYPGSCKRIVCKADKRTDNINVYFTEV